MERLPEGPIPAARRSERSVASYLLYGTIIMKIASRIAAYVGVLSVIFALVLPPTTVLAQDDNATMPTYIKFRIHTVKSGQSAEWVKLRREMSDAAKAAGWSFYHVFERRRGPGNTFLIVTPEEAIGEPGGSFVMAKPFNVPDSWFNAIWATVDSSLVLSLEYLPELRTMLDGPTHPTAKFMHLRIRTAKPDRADDFVAWMRDDLVPALRKANVGDVRNARVALGASPHTFVTASFVDGWPYAPEVIPGIDRALKKGRPLIASWVDYFYEFREDLSFTVD